MAGACAHSSISVSGQSARTHLLGWSFVCEWRVLTLAHEAPLMHMEGASVEGTYSQAPLMQVESAHARSSIHMNESRGH